MSLILEALRKSEAERRRAQAPDLFAEPAPIARQIARSPPHWLGWALAAVAAMLIAGWFARGSGNGAPPRAPDQHVPALGDVAPPAAATRPPAVLPATVADAAPRAVIAVTPAPSPAASGEPAAPAIRTVTAPPLPSVEPPPVVANAGPANAARPPPPPMAATSAAMVRPVAPAMSPPVRPAPTSDAPLRLADLSPEERLQLPALKMSMHLWDAASAQRFVIIDGQRLGEGDRLGDAVIEQITADGVLLAWHGHRLTLPMR